MQQRVYPWVRGLAVLGFLGAAAVYTAGIVLAGGNGPGFFLYSLCFVLAILLPGLFICEKTLPALRGAAKLTVAAVCGTGLLMLCYMLFGALGLPLLSGVFPLLLGLFWLVTGRRTLPTRLKAVWNAPMALWLVLLFFSVVMAVNAVIGVLGVAWPHANWHYVYPQDSLWSVGNAAAVQWGFPLRDIRMYGGVMHYHYLSDVIAGLLKLFSFQSAWDSVLYFNWPIWCGLLLLGSWALGRLLGAGPWLSLLLPAATALLYNAQGDGLIHFYKNPNGVVQSYFYLIACLLVLRHLEKHGAEKHFRSLLPFALAIFTLVFGKSTTGITLLLAMAAAFAVHSLVARRLSKSWLPALLCGVVVTAVLFLTIMAGGSMNVNFMPSLASFSSVFSELLFKNWFLSIPYLLSAIHCLVHIRKASLTILCLHAMVVGGVLACCLFSHYGSSERYFLLTAMFLMPFCVVQSLAARARARAGAVGGAAFVLCVAVAFMLCVPTYITWTKTGVGAAIRSLRLGALIDYTNLTMSAEDEEAALWLKEHMAPDEMFATNRFNNTEFGNDGIFHFYTAISERQCFMEGWQYALDYSVEYEYYFNRRYYQQHALFALDSNYGRAAALAQHYGIRYLLIHKNTQYEIPLSGGTPVFENSDVWIYEMV